VQRLKKILKNSGYDKSQFYNLKATIIITSLIMSQHTSNHWPTVPSPYMYLHSCNITSFSNRNYRIIIFLRTLYGKSPRVRQNSTTFVTHTCEITNNHLLNYMLNEPILCFQHLHHSTNYKTCNTVYRIAYIHSNRVYRLQVEESAAREWRCLKEKFGMLL
jgi:hypothetical protein